MLIKWPDGASLRQGEGPCASVVSRGVEQSGLREGGPVYISISAAVFKGLRRRRCGWMTAWSSRLLVRLYLGYRWKGVRNTASMHVFVGCQAQCWRACWEDFTSQLWLPAWCLWFFWGLAFLGFSSLILLGLQGGPVLARFCHLGKFWLLASPCRVRQVLVPPAAYWAVDHS